ncbi:MAG TPA: hypothetical protein VF101_16055 [Gaiellaceae bacterium]
MRWKLEVLAALVLVVLLQMHTAGASIELKGPGTIRITERQLALDEVDVGIRGRSPGDLEIMRSSLYNTRITPKPIGHAELVCTYTGGRSRSCNGTYVLPRGKLVVSGQLLFRQFFQLAVVGGTGLYDNVRGTLTVTALGGKARQNLVLFRLVA